MGGIPLEWFDASLRSEGESEEDDEDGPPTQPLPPDEVPPEDIPF